MSVCCLVEPLGKWLVARMEGESVDSKDAKLVGNWAGRWVDELEEL